MTSAPHIPPATAAPRRDETPRRVIVIAGPNGAGKTSFAQSFLPREAGILHFINADLIAADLSPSAPETVAFQAGRLMLERMRELTDRRESFAFETTLSGRNYLRQIRLWQSDGYCVSLIFLRLPDEETAIARVAERVRQGGHNIPEAVIRRRFHAGWQNFENHYRNLVNRWAVYDTMSESPRLLQWKRNH